MKNGYVWILGIILSASVGGCSAPTATQAGAVADIPEVTEVLTVANCPEPETDFEALYVHPEHGYCFLYPSFYDAEAPDLTVAAVTGSIFDEVNDVPLTLTVQRLDRSDGVDVETFAIEDLGEIEYTLTRGDLGAYQAVLVDDLIASTSLYDTRSAYLDVGGWLYVLTVVPEDTILPEASRQARILWNTVTNSIAFPE